MINRKLFAIKRLFFLPFDVKIQFFKSFILPYIDYCVTLLIYASATTIAIIYKLYYTCLFKLFKFKFLTLNPFIVNLQLQVVGLMSIEHRVFYRLVVFVHKTLNNEHSAKELRNWMSPCIMANQNYALRSNGTELVKSQRTRTKNSDITFKNIISVIINEFIID